jgi:TonB family protein
METLIYFGKVNLYWVLLYGCYQLVLRKHTFFELNRAYLLGSLLLAFALPFIIYPVSAPPIPILYEVNSEALTISYVQAKDPSLLNWTTLLVAVYAVGVSYMSYLLIRQISQLRSFINDGELIELDDCKIVMIDSNNVGSFSFLKWIVVNRNDYEKHFDAILRHEMVHTEQWHSVDILLLETLKIIFWFNPVLLFYKRSMQEVHEFLADSKAPNRENYATFLVSYALKAPIASLTNHFFKPSQIKERIRMIYKNRTSKWMLSSYVIALTAIGCVATFVAGCENSHKTENIPITQAAKQSGQVSGEVKDENGEPLAGANIVVNGMERGTSTSLDGKFSLEVPANGELLVSFSNFKTQTIRVGDMSKNIIIQMAKSKETSQKKLTNRPEQKKLQLSEIPTNKDDQTIFMVVEKQPEFPGGQRKMYEFLAQNIHFPLPAAEANVSGRVFLSFVVTQTGEIQNIMVLKGIGFGCDEEAVRVLKSFPKWEPGYQDGRPVSVRYNLPINFQVQEHDKSREASQATGIPIGGFAFKNPDDSETSIAFPGRAGISSAGLDTKIQISGRNPLYVLNGKVVDDNKILQKIPTSGIESVDILKNEAASGRYGARGVNGVVMITTKKI